MRTTNRGKGKRENDRQAALAAEAVKKQRREAAEAGRKLKDDIRAVAGQERERKRKASATPERRQDASVYTDHRGANCRGH
jgi:hypothetical protein